MPNQNENIKKVSPYPIDADVAKAEGQVPLKIGIVKLTDFGFLARATVIHFYKVGENYHVSFQLPASSSKISSEVKVIKTYDAIESIIGAEKSKLYTFEMHFLNLSHTNKKAIQEFIVKIGQDK